MKIHCRGFNAKDDENGGNSRKYSAPSAALEARFRGKPMRKHFSALSTRKGFHQNYLLGAGLAGECTVVDCLGRAIGIKGVGLSIVAGQLIDGAEILDLARSM